MNTVLKLQRAAYRVIHRGHSLLMNCKSYMSIVLLAKCVLVCPQGPHYATIMKPPLKLPLNMAADSLH